MHEACLSRPTQLARPIAFLFGVGHGHRSGLGRAASQERLSPLLAEEGNTGSNCDAGATAAVTSWGPRTYWAQLGMGPGAPEAATPELVAFSCPFIGECGGTKILTGRPLVVRVVHLDEEC